MKCPVLTKGMLLPDRGRKLHTMGVMGARPSYRATGVLCDAREWAVNRPIALRLCYAMPVTDVAYDAARCP
eukprot:2656603-Rhodomonas_salina.1